MRWLQPYYLVVLPLGSSLVTTRSSIRTRQLRHHSLPSWGAEEDESFEWASSAEEDDARLMEAAQSLQAPSVDASAGEVEWVLGGDDLEEEGWTESSLGDDGGEVDSLLEVILNGGPESEFSDDDDLLQSAGAGSFSSTNSDRDAIESLAAAEEAAEALILRSEEEEAEEEQEEDCLDFMTALDFMAVAESLEITMLSDRLGDVDSHELVEVDDEGEPFYERYVRSSIW